MRLNLYKSAFLALLLSILAASSYQFARPVGALCVIDRNCASKCNYCLSVKGASDPACADYESYPDLNMCYRDCDANCYQQSCITTDGFSNCNYYGYNSCGPLVNTQCQQMGYAGGTVIGNSCSSRTSSCGRNTCSFTCHQ